MSFYYDKIAHYSNEETDSEIIVEKDKPEYTTPGTEPLYGVQVKKNGFIVDFWYGIPLDTAKQELLRHLHNGNYNYETVMEWPVFTPEDFNRFNQKQKRINERLRK